MLTILSPSKTSDPTPIKIHQPTSAIFTKETAQLIAILKKKSVADLMSLMTISEKLADQNYRRFQNFNLKMDDDFSKAAILTFNGEVYVGLDAGGLSQQDLDYAQQHVRILSCLLYTSRCV